MSAPLGLYIHWPYCAKICPYCDFNVYRDRGRASEQADLAEAIALDMRTQAATTGERELVSIFLGGGTPSLMDPAVAAELVALAKHLWPAAADLEVTLEANPTDAEAERFDAFAAAGINRLSLGLQALDDPSLALLGRNHDAASARRAAAEAARRFPRLSVDLIYARPGQTQAAWARELAAAIELGAEHVSPYQLTIEAGTAFEHAVRRGGIVPPDDELGAALFDTTQTVLEAAGYDAYEVSNHARGATARSRHNLVYWTGADYVGVGPGAHGRLARPQGRTATYAHPRPADYIAAVAATGAGLATEDVLSPREAAQERVLAGLRIDAGVPFDELTALGLHPRHPEVVALVAAGMLADDARRLRATRAGRLLLDRVTSRLAA